jgi:hypothetical protein
MEEDNMTNGAVGEAYATRDAARNLDRQLEEITHGEVAGVREAPRPVGGEGGIVGYFRRSMHSRIVQFGALGLAAFALGSAYGGNVSESYAGAKKCVKGAVSYVGGAVFNALPNEQKQAILRDNAKQMTPEELMKEFNKVQEKK